VFIYITPCLSALNNRKFVGIPTALRKYVALAGQDFQTLRNSFVRIGLAIPEVRGGSLLPLIGK
jgi:hypothetical protein